MVWNQWWGQVWQLRVDLHRSLPQWGCQQALQWPWGWCRAVAAGHTDTWISDSWLSLRGNSLETPWLVPAENTAESSVEQHPPLCWMNLKFSLSGRQIQAFCLPAAWGEGWWPFVRTSPSCHRQPQTTASFSGCKSLPWRNSDWNCCSSAGWATAANNPPPQYLHREPTIYIKRPTGIICCSETQTPFTSITAALLCDDIKEALERIFKSHNFLNGSITFGELLK